MNGGDCWRRATTEPSGIRRDHVAGVANAVVDSHWLGSQP